MKNKLLIALFLLFSILGFAEEKQKVILLSDPMFKLAKVNNKDIFIKDVSDQYSKFLKDVEKKGLELNQTAHDYLVNGLVEEKINEALMLEEANKAGVQSDNAKVLEILEKFKSKFATPLEYNEYLKKKCLTEEEAKTKIEDRFRISEYEKQLFKDLKVTEQDASAFYNANENIINPPEAFNVAQIMLYYPENATDMEKSFLAEKLQETRKKILGGADFGAEAKTNSEGASAATGGIIGWINLTSNIDPKIISELKKIDKGEITPVITTSKGVHVLKLIEYRPPAPKKDFATIKDKLIEDLTMQKKQEIITSFLEKVKKEAKIEIYTQS